MNLCPIVLKCSSTKFKMTAKYSSTQLYGNYQRNNALRKHAKVRSSFFDNSDHIYVPSQPVLSCRLVDIDLSGTRTHRPKSTQDILQEQQRLIRDLYKKNRNRISVSAPARQRSNTPAKPASNHGVSTSLNIEVRGLPLTSGHLQSTVYKEKTTTPTEQSTSRTSKHFRNIQPVTDCFLLVTADKDWLALNQSTLKLKTKLSSYWRSENKNLAKGTSVRGRTNTDDVLLTTESWLTFGGGDRARSGGVVDAFANFKNSDEYYNIEGSVGSQVARQLQRGDKIRIGINGVVHSDDFKVKKWKRELICDVQTPLNEVEKQEDIINDNQNISDLPQEEGEKMEADLHETVSDEGDILQDTVLTMNENEPDQINGDQEDIKSPYGLNENDFKELIISGLDEFEKEITDQEKIGKNLIEKQHKPSAPATDSPAFDEEAVKEAMKLGTPLSWDDQCSKSNVKIIQPKVSPTRLYRPVMSETFPVKFEKLIKEDYRPKLAKAVSDGYSIKQRSSCMPHDDKESLSKIKVVYVSPHTPEEEEVISGISIDEIINMKLEGRARKISMSDSFKDHNDQIISSPASLDISTLRSRSSSTKSEPHSKLFTSGSSNGDRGIGFPGPRFKIRPVHSAANGETGTLRIMSANIKNSPRFKDKMVTHKIPQKVTTSKLIHGNQAGNRNGNRRQHSGETEYINIISRLNVVPGSNPSTLQPQKSETQSPHPNSLPKNSVQDPDYQNVGEIHLEDEVPDNSAEIGYEDSNLPSTGPAPSPDNEDESPAVDGRSSDDSYRKELTSPASLTALINIPTADEEYSALISSKHETRDDLFIKEQSSKAL